MGLWPILVAIGGITYATRLSFVLLFGRLDIPVPLARALRFVPPAVLAAIIFPDLLRHDGTLNLSPGNARLLAGILAMLVAWRTRSVMLTIVIGMVALVLLQALLR